MIEWKDQWWLCLVKMYIEKQAEMNREIMFILKWKSRSE